MKNFESWIKLLIVFTIIILLSYFLFSSGVQEKQILAQKNVSTTINITILAFFAATIIIMLRRHLTKQYYMDPEKMNDIKRKKHYRKENIFAFLLFYPTIAATTYIMYVLVRVQFDSQLNKLFFFLSLIYLTTITFLWGIDRAGRPKDTYLEEENSILCEETNKLKEENEQLRIELSDCNYKVIEKMHEIEFENYYFRESLLENESWLQDENQKLERKIKKLEAILARLQDKKIQETLSESSDKRYPKIFPENTFVVQTPYLAKVTELKENAATYTNMFVECFIKYERKDVHKMFRPTELVAIRIYWNPGGTTDIYPIQPTIFTTNASIELTTEEGIVHEVILQKATSWDTYIEKRLKYAKENGKPTDKKLTKHIIEKSSKNINPDIYNQK